MKNDYEIRGDITAIFLNRKDGSVMETIISTSDLERMKNYKNTWNAALYPKNQSFYVIGRTELDNGKRVTISLHRWIMNSPKKLYIDHINHNTLDNTRDNLRIATASQNGLNRKGPSKRTTTGVRGVNFEKKLNKYKVQLMVNRKKLYFGVYDTIEEANYVAIEARKQYLEITHGKGDME